MFSYGCSYHHKIIIIIGERPFFHATTGWTVTHRGLYQWCMYESHGAKCRILAQATLSRLLRHTMGYGELELRGDSVTVFTGTGDLLKEQPHEHCSLSLQNFVNLQILCIAV